MPDLNHAHGSQYFPYWYRYPGLRLIIATLAFSFSANLYAEVPLPILSGSSGWEASLDNSTWIPAYGSYPNPISRPVVITDNPDPARPTLMWYWGDGEYTGIPDGQHGPSTVYFRYKFFLGEDYELLLRSGERFGAFMAADDYMDVSVNGESLGWYDLGVSQLPNGQPDVTFKYFHHFLNPGENIITIIAQDTRSHYEWVFFDAQHIGSGDRVSFQSVTEPASLALIVAGLGLIRTLRYRRCTSLRASPNSRS